MDARIDGYTLHRLIGQGGFGQVFLAERGGQVCVLKRLHDEVTERKDVVGRFMREAEVSSQLSHPNIARVLGARFDDEHRYIAFEFIEGLSLHVVRARLAKRGRPLDTGASLTIVQAILQALSYIHAQGLVHRDLKPGNVMVGFDGVVRIIDFGIAQLEAAPALTKQGHVVGTFSYMAPEQAKGERVDHRADQFAVGMILYELLSQRRVHPSKIAGKTLSRRTLRRRVVEGALAPLRSVAPDVSPALSEAVMRAVAKRPEDRFESVAAMLEALQRAGPAPYDLQSLMRAEFAKEAQKVKEVLEQLHDAAPVLPHTAIALMPAELSISDEPASLTAPQSMGPKPKRTLAPWWIGGALLLCAALGALLWADFSREVPVQIAPVKQPRAQRRPPKVVPSITPRTAPDVGLPEDLGVQPVVAKPPPAPQPKAKDAGAASPDTPDAQLERLIQAGRDQEARALIRKMARDQLAGPQAQVVENCLTLRMRLSRCARLLRQKLEQP